MTQVEESTALKLTSESPMFTWAVKHAQWLINRYTIGSDGKTAYTVDHCACLVSGLMQDCRAARQ